MALEEELSNIGNSEVGSIAIDYGCTLVKCGESGKGEYMYVERLYKNMTLRDCMEHFCPETPKDIREFHDMLLGAFSETFSGLRDDEIRSVLAKSLELLEGYVET